MSGMREKLYSFHKAIQKWGFIWGKKKIGEKGS